MAFDVVSVRAAYPALADGFAYLDGAAGTQVPASVIDAIRAAYRAGLGNAGGEFPASLRSTALTAECRQAVADLVGGTADGVILGPNMTTLTYRLAYTLASRWGAGDEVIISRLDHDANVRPWVQAAAAAGATVRWADVQLPEGDLPVPAFAGLISERTRLVAVTAASNLIGTRPDVPAITALARAAGALSYVDGVHATPHGPVDVRALGADFYAFSGHKLYAPTGIGVLYGREELLAAMAPWQGGGDMILTVSFEKTTYNDLPWKFEAGTPNISGAVGLAAAMDYVEGLGLAAIAAHEQQLLQQTTHELGRLPGIELIGTAAHKASIVSFTMRGVHAHDLGTILDAEGVAVRTGHHCAMPVMTFFGLPATARASFGCYNTAADVEALVAALGKAREVFG